MTARALTQLVLLHRFLAAATLLALTLTVFRGLLTELADEIRASRNETINNRNRLRGNMDTPKNRRLDDIVSRHRAINAQLAAVLGDTSRAKSVLDDAQYYAGNAALPIRRSL
jgi:hypothetical protein